MNGWWKAGLAGGAQGLMQGVQLGMQQRRADQQAAMEERRAKLQDEQLKELVRKSKYDMAKSNMEAQDKGFMWDDKSESFVPDPGFYTPYKEEPSMTVQPAETKFGGMMDKPLGAAPASGLESLGVSSGMAPGKQKNPQYARMEAIAKFKAMASPRVVQPGSQLTVRQTYAAAGLDMPPELEPIADNIFDHRNNSLITSTNRPASPEQQRAWSGLTGMAPGAAKGISRKGFESTVSNVIGQRAAGERQGKAIAATNARADASREQAARHHNENLNLQEEKAVMDPVSELNEKLAELQRLGAHVDQSAKYNPSWSDYQATRAKFGAQSVLGSYTPSGMKPSADDEQRYEFYQGLGQDYVRNLFSSGGKNLTRSEERLAGNLAINPGDTKEQIRNKGKAIKDFMQSKLGAQLESIQRVNPKAAADLRVKYDQVMMDLDSRLINASERRARGATSGDVPKASMSEREASAKRLNMGEDADKILAAIDDPKNKDKNMAGQEAHAKAAPRLYGKKPTAPTKRTKALEDMTDAELDAYEKSLKGVK